jgi:PAS domain S-box-containing protein
MSNEIAHSHSSRPKLIAGFSAAAIVLVLGIVWLLCSALIESHTSAGRHLHIQQLCGTIMHLNEVLTMSAKMCAATGSMDWKEHYDRYELELDRAIQEAEALVPLSGPEPSEDISAVNARLVEMEQEAFRLTAQGMGPEAMALLESDQYKLDKQKYSEATQDRAHAMLRDVRSSLSRQRWESLTTTAGAIVVMFLILGIAFISSKAMRQHLAQLRRTEESLREAHEMLEQRVAGRTAELAMVNEQLRTEMARRQQSEERYRSLVETTSDWVWEVDHRGVYTYVSPRVMDLLGFAPEDILGKTPFDLMAPDEVERVATMFRGAVERRESLTALENTNLHKDGRPVVLETSAVPVFGEDGELLGYRGIDRNITKRKKAEKALQREHQTVKQLLEASDRELKLIAYEIHDGLAQLLTATMMQCQTHNRLKGDNPEEASRACDTGQQLLAKCLSEVRRLISRVRLPLLDERGVVEAVRNLVFDTTGQSEADIDFHSQVKFERLKPVVENAIYRIVQESLANAMRHSKSDRVRVALSQDDEYVRVEVTDWGIGCDTENVGPQSYGLAGIRERARLLGGRATIDSTLGEGTRVVVELPLEECETT